MSGQQSQKSALSRFGRSSRRNHCARPGGTPRWAIGLRFASLWPACAWSGSLSTMVALSGVVDSLIWDALVATSSSASGSTSGHFYKIST